MSGSGRKRVSKWDSNEEATEHLNGKSSNSHFRDKDAEHARFHPEDDGSSRRPAPGDDPGEAWPPRSGTMMSYYEQDETRQPYFRQSPSRERLRTRRSGSRSNSRSRSRSRSPVQRVRRDAGGSSYNRHKTREVDGSRYNRADEYDWEAKNRKTSYYTEEQYPLRVVGGKSDYSSEDNNNSRRETQRRDVPEREYNRSSNIPCRYFAFGNCRNGTSCRFSHDSDAPPARKPQDEMFSRHDNNHSGTTERMRSSHRGKDIKRSDTGKSSEAAKGNNGSWIDNMEMSPDWNYGVKTLQKPLNEEQDSLAPVYEHGSAAVSQQDGDRRSIGMFPIVGENAIASSHHSFSNNIANTAPPVQAFSQNIENHSAVPYQSTPLPVVGSQMLPPGAAATHLPGGVYPENGNAQNTVSREELNHISNISASLAQLFGNGQPIPNLHLPEVYGQKEQSSHIQTDILSNNSINTGVVPTVTALQINNSDSLVSLAGNPKASSEENRDKGTDEEASKKPDRRKTRQEEETAEDAEKVVEEDEEDDDDGAGDENKKKEKDPKGMRAFKFALVEIVKELLKPAWKEGGMNKEAYKNIAKKVVDKVTGAIQTGNIPQTQEKIDHYLSASKPKLTKLVQAYISKVKKS